MCVSAAVAAATTITVLVCARATLVQFSNDPSVRLMQKPKILVVYAFARALGHGYQPVQLSPDFHEDLLRHGGCDGRFGFAERSPSPFLVLKQVRQGVRRAFRWVYALSNVHRLVIPVVPRDVLVLDLGRRYLNYT